MGAEVRVIVGGKQDSKLVPAEPRNRNRLLNDRRLESLCNFAKHFVADMMTVSVIDRLEAIKIGPVALWRHRRLRPLPSLRINRGGGWRKCCWTGSRHPTCPMSRSPSLPRLWCAARRGCRPSRRGQSAARIIRRISPVFSTNCWKSAAAKCKATIARSGSFRVVWM